MKHLLWILLATAVCFAACAPKSNELSGRKNPKGGGGGAGAGTKLSDDVNPNLGPDHASAKAEQPTTRRIVINEKRVDTSILCTENIAATAAKPERIKIQGGSKVIFRQVEGQKTAPERDHENNIVASQALFHLDCNIGSADLNKIPQSDAVQLMKLTVGDTDKVAGKFSTQSEDIQAATIACGNKTDIADAANIMKNNKGQMDMLIGEGSKMLIEVQAQKSAKHYVLVTCDANAQDNTPEVDAMKTRKKTDAETEKDSAKDSSDESNSSSPKDEMHQDTGEKTQEPSGDGEVRPTSDSSLLER